MKQKFRPVLFLLLFTLWTVLLRLIDVQPIGPNGSAVGFATLNGCFHRFTGVHMTLYHITDWAGLVPVFVGFGFAVLGLAQWIRRRNILKVDFSILILGAYYLLVLGVYLFFEAVIINYRPVLINNYLEASYPSSTTLLVLTVMPTAALQLRSRIKNSRLRRIAAGSMDVFTVLIISGRLISGVHWLTDIVGAILLSAFLVSLYKVTLYCSRI